MQNSLPERAGQPDRQMNMVTLHVFASLRHLLKQGSTAELKFREDILEFSSKIRLMAIASTAVLTLVGGPAVAQWSSESEMLEALPDFSWYSPYESDSAGRGWAYIDAREYEQVGAAGQNVASAPYEAPEGIEPLERDIFNSDDFYLDRALWSDPRYFRCNSGYGLESQWGAYPSGATIIDDNADSAPWGHCDRDYPREGIVSPYPFETARDHYEALMAEAEAKGGPTVHTQQTMPDWSGRYTRKGGRNDGYENWWWVRINQTSTLLSLLTEEYQTRMVQEAYHHANTNAAQWPSSYCWPEGLMRRWHLASVQGFHELMVTPTLVQWLMGTADNFLQHYHVGRDFNYEGAVPRLGQDVPRWYGESIAFWDEDALITWTSNVQGWITHGSFEHSNQLQVIEIFTPFETENFSGLHHESIFYDPEALVEPVRQIQWYEKASDFTEGNPYVYVECNQTIFPIDGVATPTTPGQTIEYTIPDRFGRPWAKIWEDWHEEGMQRPEAEGLFGF